MLTSLLLRTLLNFITINFQRLNLFWQSALQNPHKNARTTYKNRSRLSPTVFVAVGLRRAMWSLLRLNSTKRPKFAEMFRTPRLCPVLLSWVLTVITSPDATQLDKTVLLSWIGSGDVITVKTQLNKTVLLSWVASGDVIEPLGYGRRRSCSQTDPWSSGVGSPQPSRCHFEHI